jgi:sugar lactone lactonase YvrE
MQPRIVPVLLVMVCALTLALASCGGDSSSPAQPEVNDPVFIYAGNAHAGFGAMGQLPQKTRLYWPQDVAFSPEGTPIVVDWNNHRVITVDADGKFMVIAGSSTNDFGDPCPPSPTPCTNIVATTAKLNHPTHVCFDQNGNMVLCAWHNSELFLLNTATGLMDRFCGTGFRPCFGPVNNDPQPAISACVDLPASVAFDLQNRLCFTDQANQIIRMVDETGTISTIAGTQPVWVDSLSKFLPQFGFSGDGGPATSAKLSFERGQAADPSGKICFDNLGNLYIADTKNHAVRTVDTNGIITRFAGMAPVGSGGVAGFSGDGGPATSAMLNEPRDVAADSKGNIYIADTGNHVIRMVNPNGNISTIVGVPRRKLAQPLEPLDVLAENGKSAATIHLTGPSGIEIDPKGRLWIADTQNNVVRYLKRQ